MLKITRRQLRIPGLLDNAISSGPSLLIKKSPGRQVESKCLLIDVTNKTTEEIEDIAQAIDHLNGITMLPNRANKAGE